MINWQYSANVKINLKKVKIKLDKSEISDIIIIV